MEPTRKVAVLTTSRADFGHLYWPLVRLREREDVELSLIAAAAHLSPEFGFTVNEVEREGFQVDAAIECLLSSDTGVGMAKTIGLATLGLADALDRIRPDLFLLIADRYEMLAPASVALALRIPMAHIEGGEISEGAVDDAVRNALTKMAHVHFTPTEAARRRVIAMGEEPWRVHRSGAPSLDHLRHGRLPSREDVERELAVALRPGYVVASVHPATLEADPLADGAAVLAALRGLDRQIVFCFPNADAGSRALVEGVREMCASRADAHLYVNLPHTTYWGLLAGAAALVGNSSSGIMETPSVPLPCVNVGDRQRGRTRAKNVIDSSADAAAVTRALDEVLSSEFRASLDGMENPYGDGRAGERIAEVLATVPLGEKLLRKQALPVAAVDGRDGVYAFES